jgi:CHASE2 domain-containing sensor protein
MLTFSKEIFTKTIQKLRQDGVRAIGIDVVFANPDPAI